MGLAGSSARFSDGSDGDEDDVEDGEDSPIEMTLVNRRQKDISRSKKQRTPRK